MIPELEPEEFVSFLADLWSERGWDVSVKERADETRFVIGKRGDGKRGVIYVFPTTTATVTERHLKQFVRFCRKRSIDVAVVATQGAFAEGAQRVAAQRSVHLLDRSKLADTVEEGDLAAVLQRYTETSRLEAVTGRLRDLGVPVSTDALPDGISGIVSTVASLVAAAVAWVSAKISGDVGVTYTGNDDDADESGGRSLASRSVPLAALPIVLVVALVIGAMVGPAVGLGAVSPFGAGSDGGVEVSSVSTAGANATLDVYWNARTTDSLTVNGTTYDAPEGQTFVLVRMNVTNGADSPTQFEQTALSIEVSGVRYGHQPLDGATGFSSAGLFEPDENREVWTVFSVPADTESATLLYDGDAGVRFERSTSLTPEATMADKSG